MTPDSLVAALRAVPSRINYDAFGNATVEPDFPALAAAVREWISRQMPASVSRFVDVPYSESYNAALADVAARLGL